MVITHTQRQVICKLTAIFRSHGVSIISKHSNAVLINYSGNLIKMQNDHNFVSASKWINTKYSNIHRIIINVQINFCKNSGHFVSDSWKIYNQSTTIFTQAKLIWKFHMHRVNNFHYLNVNLYWKYGNFHRRKWVSAKWWPVAFGIKGCKIFA